MNQRLKNTLIKTGVIGGATLLTHFGVDSLESLDVVSNFPFFKNAVDLLDSSLTTLVPYKTAGKYFNSRTDYSIGKYAIQVLSCAIGFPEVAKDLGYIVAVSDFRTFWADFISKTKGYISLAGALFPFLSKIRDVLRR